MRAWIEGDSLCAEPKGGVLYSSNYGRRYRGREDLSDLCSLCRNSHVERLARTVESRMHSFRIKFDKAKRRLRKSEHARYIGLGMYVVMQRGETGYICRMRMKIRKREGKDFKVQHSTKYSLILRNQASRRRSVCWTFLAQRLRCCFLDKDTDARLYANHHFRWEIPSPSLSEKDAISCFAHTHKSRLLISDSERDRYRYVMTYMYLYQRSISEIGSSLRHITAHVERLRCSIKY